MSDKLILIRMLLRWSMVVVLVSAIVIGLIILVRELPDNPNAALIGLLVLGFAGLAEALKETVKAFGRSKKADDNGDD